MNADLRAELEENPDLTPVVARLRAAREIAPVRRRGERRTLPRLFLVTSSLLAASLFAALAFASWFGGGAPAAYGAREYRMTPAEIIASQNADGSWQNDFLTRRNAEVLRLCETPGAQVAYKKAMRNLRVRGVL